MSSLLQLFDQIGQNILVVKELAKKLYKTNISGMFRKIAVLKIAVVLYFLSLLTSRGSTTQNNWSSLSVCLFFCLWSSDLKQGLTGTLAKSACYHVFSLFQNFPISLSDFYFIAL